jgi:hypothetical protein
MKITLASYSKTKAFIHSGTWDLSDKGSIRTILTKEVSPIISSVSKITLLMQVRDELIVSSQDQERFIDRLETTSLLSKKLEWYKLKFLGKKPSTGFLT